MSVVSALAELRSCRGATLGCAAERNIRCSGRMLDIAGCQGVEPVWVGQTRGAGTLRAWGERCCLARPASAVWCYIAVYSVPVVCLMAVQARRMHGLGRGQ